MEYVGRCQEKNREHIDSNRRFVYVLSASQESEFIVVMAVCPSTLRSWIIFKIIAGFFF
jgi:hypothetical protein